MPFATFAAGPYTATFNTDGAAGNPAGKGLGARDLGLVEGVRRWLRVLEAQPVLASAFGGTAIDGVYRGGQCFCRMTFQEWTPAVRAALWPLADGFGQLGPIGILLSDLAGELVLTAAAGTPASTAGPAVLRFGKAIIAPSQEIDVPLGDVERNVPVAFRCFPYVNAQNKVVWFEET
jgi:hypothetical protein